jgi:hypothetical protein
MFSFLGTSLTMKGNKKDIQMLKDETESKIEFKTSILANSKP